MQDHSFEAVIDDVATHGWHVLRQPRNAIARAELRRALQRLSACQSAAKAERSLEAAAPTGGDPRPEPSLEPDEAPPARQVRLPYKED